MKIPQFHRVAITHGERIVERDWECWSVRVGDTAIASFEKREDADLDAGAPEMLEACIIARNHIGDYRNGDGIAKYHTVSILDRAIAKATGGAA